jgi:hypothetical protein
MGKIPKDLHADLMNSPSKRFKIYIRIDEDIPQERFNDYNIDIVSDYRKYQVSTLCIIGDGDDLINFINDEDRILRCSPVTKVGI